MSGEIFRTNSLGRLSGWLCRWMDWRLWLGWSRPDTGLLVHAGRTRDLSRLSLRPGQLLAAWSPPASCPRSGSGYLVSTHAATSSKEGAETGQASGQQWLDTEVPRPATGPQCCGAAVLQGTDRGVAADLVTADCSSTSAAAAAGHKRPSWSWSCS